MNLILDVGCIVHSPFKSMCSGCSYIKEDVGFSCSSLHACIDLHIGTLPMNATTPDNLMTQIVALGLLHFHSKKRLKIIL